MCDSLAMQTTGRWLQTVTGFAPLRPPVDTLWQRLSPIEPIEGGAGVTEPQTLQSC